MFEVFLKPKAEKELDKIESIYQKNIIKELLGLQENPYPNNSIKLKDTDFYRIRVGNYRIIYEISKNEKLVTISHILHRKDAY